MKQSRIKPHLGIFFVVAVMLPSVILSVIAVRSLSREEAYIEKRMHDALFAEVTHVSSVVANELNTIQRELSSSISSGSLRLNELSYSLGQWKKKIPLIDVPFLVSQTGEILWPRYDAVLSKDEKAFLNWNKQFFQDEVKIPVYENIAVAYKEEIARQDSGQGAWISSRSLSEGEDRKDKRDFSKNSALTSQGVESAEQYQNYPVYGDKSLSQQAISSFEQSVPLRQKIYETAKKTGKNITLRKVQLGDQTQPGYLALPQQESIFVSEPLSFSQILSKDNSGIIPRSINETLRLIFWKKIQGGYVVGCVINPDNFKDRIIGVLPAIYSSARMLTVLDEAGRPIITPKEVGRRNWQRPFAAKEISSMLPHWEVAAYLANPRMVSVEAKAVTLIMWILIMILFISISSGGFLVLRSLRSEMALARQKTNFVANVSHELKTPLTSIKMFAEMLKERRQNDETKKEKYLDLMVSETDRLTRLINNVLDFSRMEQGKKQYVFKKENIVVLCRELFEAQRLRLENNGFAVTFLTDINELFLEIDVEAIKQALINLLSNAEKYSDGGRNIDLELTHNSLGVSIAAKDKGKGVPQQEVQKIFKEFYRIDDSLTSRVKGTGLGLTIAQRIAKDHGGDIVYSQRDDGGSIFTIILPFKANK